MRNSENNDFMSLEDFSIRHSTLMRILCLVLLILVLVMCWNIGTGHEFKETEAPYFPATNLEEDMSENFPWLVNTRDDMDTDSAGASVIDLSSCEGTCLITEEGKYILKGNLKGRVLIKAPEQLVHLFLDGVDIESSEGPAILAEEARKVVITLMEESENTVSDHGDYRNWPDFEAAVSCACDLTLNGTGTLTLNGFYKDALRSRDVLRILGGSYSIKCKRTAVHGNDGIHVSGGDFFIASEKNGFRTKKGGIQGRGDLMISGGTFNIIAGRYAFLTDRGNLYIFDCAIKDKSVVSTFQIAGIKRIEGGCLQ